MTNDLHILQFPLMMGDFHAIPSVKTVRKYAAEIRSQCDLVVLVAHIAAGEKQAFLKEPGVPMIAWGHIHVGLDQAMSAPGHVLVPTTGLRFPGEAGLFGMCLSIIFGSGRSSL